MKYVVIRYEDTATQSQNNRTSLLESARSKHLLQLAQAGAAGIIRAQDKSREISLLLHSGCLGLRSEDPGSAIGSWYAAALGIKPEDGETVWCSDFVTHQDGRIIDAEAGSITTVEAKELINALNKELGSATRRWIPGEGSHHALVLRGEIAADEGRRAHASPRAVMCSTWRRTLPRGSGTGGLRLLMEQTAKVLEAHPVNHVRVDLGENPANLAWVWSPAHPSALRSFRSRTGLSGAVASSGFALRGLAKALDMTLVDGLGGCEETALRRLEKQIEVLASGHDVVYAHLQVPAGKPVDRLVSVERVDRFLLKPLTEHLAETQPWRLMILLDDSKTGNVAFVAIGTGLPQQPAAQLSMEEFSNRGLSMKDAAELFDWFLKDAEVA